MSTDGDSAYICTHGGQEPGRAPTRSPHLRYINGIYKCAANVEESYRNPRTL